MRSLFAPLLNKIQTYRLRKRYPLAVIYPNAVIDRKTLIDEYAVVFDNVQLQNSFIGRFSYIQKNSSCTNVEIGPFCSIASNVVIGVVDHPLSYISTSPVFYDTSQPLPFFLTSVSIKKVIVPRTKIGADVWIGQGVIIKAGIEVGIGAVIGAGSVVTRNVPPYSIYGGVPAKLIRLRFEESVCRRLIESAWWTLSKESLISLSKHFDSPENFLAQVEKI